MRGGFQLLLSGSRFPCCGASCRIFRAGRLGWLVCRPAVLHTLLGEPKGTDDLTVAWLTNV